MQLLAKLSLFFNKTFALWVIVVGALAYAFPSTFKPLGAYIAPLLGIVMFGMGLTLMASDFREVVRQPRDVIIGILSQFLIMPIVAYLLCLVMHLPPEIAVGVILVGCCPGGTASNVMTFLARGDLPLSVTITSCTTLLAPVVTPFLIWVFAKQWVDISPVAMFVSIVEIVLLPIALGVVVHTVLGKKVEGFAAAMPLISVVAIALIVAAVVAATANKLLAVGPLVFLVVVLHNGFGYLFGYWTAKLLGLNLAKRKCLAIEVGMQNSGLGVALATTHFAAMPMAAVPSAVFSFWHNVSGPILATVFHRWHEEGEKETFLDKIEKQKAG